MQSLIISYYKIYTHLFGQNTSNEETGGNIKWQFWEVSQGFHFGCLIYIFVTCRGYGINPGDLITKKMSALNFILGKN